MELYQNAYQEEYSVNPIDTTIYKKYTPVINKKKEQVPNFLNSVVGLENYTVEIKFNKIKEGNKVSIGVLSQIVGYSPKYLRDLEDKGVITSCRSSHNEKSNWRMYSVQDVCRALNASSFIDEELREELFTLAVERCSEKERELEEKWNPNPEHWKELSAINEFWWMRPLGYSTSWNISLFRKWDRIYTDKSCITTVGELRLASAPRVWASNDLDIIRSMYQTKNYYVELENIASAHFQSEIKRVDLNQDVHSFRLVSLRRITDAD